MNGKRLVAVGLIGSAGCVGLRALLQTDLPTYRNLIGLAVAFAGLGILAEIRPDLAGPLALLVLVTVTLETGDTLFPDLERLMAGKAPKRKVAPKVPNASSPTGAGGGFSGGGGGGGGGGAGGTD